MTGVLAHSLMVVGFVVLIIGSIIQILTEYELAQLRQERADGEPRNVSFWRVVKDSTLARIVVLPWTAWLIASRPYFNKRMRKASCHSWNQRTAQ